MITGYNFHIQGKRHKASNTVCQDYSLAHNISGTWKIVAVADGVSSSAHSEVASEIACKTSCEFIEKAFPFDDFTAELVEGDIKSVIKSAMHAAANAVEAYADSIDEDYSDFDTTLVLALYNGDKAYVGYVGDSGIVLLKDDGDIVFSNPMNDEQGHVFPLRCRNAYVTDIVDNIAAVYCTTDGLFFDAFLQFGIRSKQTADFLIPYSLFSANELGTEETVAYLETFKDKLIALFENSAGLTDDISVSFLMNTEKNVVKPVRKPIDIVAKFKAISAVYTDEDVQKTAFRLNMLTEYPDLTDEEIFDLYEDKRSLEQVLAEHGETNGSSEPTFKEDPTVTDNNPLPETTSEPEQVESEAEVTANNDPEQGVFNGTDNKPFNTPDSNNSQNSDAEDTKQADSRFGNPFKCLFKLFNNTDSEEN